MSLFQGEARHEKSGGHLPPRPPVVSHSHFISRSYEPTTQIATPNLSMSVDPVVPAISITHLDDVPVDVSLCLWSGSLVVPPPPLPCMLLPLPPRSHGAQVDSSPSFMTRVGFPIPELLACCSEASETFSPLWT